MDNGLINKLVSRQNQRLIGCAAFEVNNESLNVFLLVSCILTFAFSIVFFVPHAAQSLSEQTSDPFLSCDPPVENRCSRVHYYYCIISHGR